MISDKNKDLVEKFLKSPSKTKRSSEDKHQQFISSILSDDNNPLGVTPLIFGVINNLFEIVDLMEEHGGRIHFVGKRGNSVLHYVGAHGDVGGLEYCLKKKCDINLQNNEGDSPIFMAIVKENAHLVSEMIANGAKLDIRNKEGYTPLHQAVEVENDEIYRMIKDRFPKKLLKEKVRKLNSDIIPQRNR